MPVGNPKTMKNFRLSDEAIELLEKFSAERGISQAAVIEQAVRDFTHRESGSPDGSANAKANSEDSARKSA